MLMWSFHDSLLLRCTPKYFSLLGQLLTFGCEVYILPSLALFFFVKMMASHLDGWNSIDQPYLHLWRLLRSASSILMSSSS